MSQELENRFEEYARKVRDFCKQLKWDIINTEYIKQAIRASASIGANYIEASDPLGKADEKMKIRIARRESKETIHFISLFLTYENMDLENQRKDLVDECMQIRKILSAILIKLG